MHILMATPGFPPLPGGGERYVRALAQALVKLGQQVTVVAGRAQTEADFWQGTGRREEDSAEISPHLSLLTCPIRPFPGGRAGLLAWRKAMVLLSALPGNQSALLEKMAAWVPRLDGYASALARVPLPVDVVHGFNSAWESALLAAWRWAQPRRIPYVVTPFAHFGADWRGRVARNSMMDHQRQVLAQADAVLTLTPVEEAGLAAWGVKPRRVQTVWGGLEPLPPLRDAAAARERLGVGGEYVLFIGRTSFDKGALHAARAILALQPIGIPLQLILAGQITPEFNRFYARLDAAARTRVRPLGVVSETEKHALLAGAQALLLPSRVDSFGIVILEAWAHGKPVVGARAGGIAGLIRDGVDGCLVPFGQVAALAEVVRRWREQPELRHQLGLAGQQRVARDFHWSAVAERVLAVYTDLI